VQSHTSIFLKRHTLLTKTFRLFKPSRHSPPGMIDYLMAGVFSILLGRTENFAHQPGVLLSASQTGDLSVGRHFAWWNLLNYREDFVNQSFIHHKLFSHTFIIFIMNLSTFIFDILEIR